MEVGKNRIDWMVAECNMHSEVGGIKNLTSKSNVDNFLQRQVEFYFSDSNLLKDVKMNQLLAKNKKGYLPFKILLKFNRIKNYLKQQNIEPGLYFQTLAEAFSKSKFLQVNKLKNMVKRIERFSRNPKVKAKLEKEVEHGSIYVDNVAPGVNESKIADTFSTFGHICKVTLPRHSSGQHKGYCFVHFADPSSVSKVIRVTANSQTLSPSNFLHEFKKSRIITKSQWAEAKKKLEEVFL